jgi:hypothetical protein
MEKDPSSNDPKIQRSNRIGWKNVLLNVGISVLILLLYSAYSAYDENHSKRSSVVAIVDHWSQSQTKGDFQFYTINVTLSDGSKVAARATPIGSAPPKSGEHIELVKIESTLGFTSYRWERSILTWEEAVGSRR